MLSSRGGVILVRRLLRLHGNRVGVDASVKEDSSHSSRLVRVKTYR